MTFLEEKTAQLNRLIINGETVKAIGLFYAENISMQENEAAARLGKMNCIKAEKENLSNSSEVKFTLLNQTINNESGIVMSEWKITYTDKNGNKKMLQKISVQQWKNGLIEQEKFYYNNILDEISSTQG
jgi:hypothetical protein